MIEKMVFLWVARSKLRVFVHCIFRLRLFYSMCIYHHVQVNVTGSAVM